MMAENERDFKGVWIPKAVWLDTRLNALDKIILTEIDSLDNGERGCWASNKYIADFCQCSETKVSTAISKLIEYGYIYLQSFDGRQRVLKSRLSNFERQDFKKSEADFQDMKQSNIYNNTNNNTENKDNNIGKADGETAKPSEKDIEAEFETLWKLYPRKEGKKNALAAYKRARKKGTTFEQVKDGVIAYAGVCTGRETRYIKQGSTWFNGECWNDEIGGSNNGNAQAGRNTESGAKPSWAGNTI